MKFQVTGSSRDTGARMSLEISAESKAAAERKAIQQGMNVLSVQDISDGEPAHTGVNRPPRQAGGSGGLVKVLMLLMILVIAGYFLWPRLMHLIGR